MTTNGEPIPTRSCCNWQPVLLLALIALACFAAVAPFLRLIEFSNGGENAVIASVQEIHRGTSPWLVPTLHEEQRTKKPPLATWISALSARPETTAKFSDPSQKIRDQAFQDFAWQTRKPALAAMSVVVFATGILGMLIGGARLGVVAACVCGSSVFWLQSARLATTDAQLAQFVTIANCFLAWGLFKRRWWPAMIGAAVALALAMMSKGPVALLQSALPVIAFAVWRRWRRPAPVDSDPFNKPSTFIWPLIVGIALFFILGGAWYLLVYLNNPAVWKEWMTELSRKGATGLEPSRWYNYVLLLGAIFPWTFFLVVGLAGSITNVLRREPRDTNAAGDRIVLVLMLLLVPILVMSFFPDRKLRYLIPLLAPASVLAAWAVLELLAPVTRWKHTGMLVTFLHWLPLTVAAIGLPVGAQLGYLEQFDGGPWYSMKFSVAMAEIFAVTIVLMMIAQRYARVGAVAGGTLLLMLAWNAVFNTGYRTGREGRSEMKPLADQILAEHPKAQIYSFRLDRPARHAPIDLSIYLNRTIVNVGSPSELKDTSGERLYLTRKKQSLSPDDPMALAPPEGGPWKLVATTPVDDSTWYTFSVR